MPQKPLQSLLNEYEQTLTNKAPTTVDAYLRAISQWLDWLAQRTTHREIMLPEHLTQTALSMYLTELKRSGYSVSHRARLKAAVGGFAQWLIREGCALQRNPTDGIEIPAETMRAPRQLGETQRLILRELVEKADDLRGTAMFALGYWAGCRVSDVSWLRMRDTHINQRVGQIRVGHKGGKWREIDLVNAVRRPLYNYIKKSRRYRDSEYVFTSQKGPRLTEAGIHHWWRNLKTQASKADWEEIESITFHDLRHDFAHRAREKGWTLEELAYYLGHVTRQGTPAIQSTVRYTQIRREDLKTKLRLLDE